MKAYNCECKCGLKTDRIVKGNEEVKCPTCKEPMIKVGGPIGGINILPLGFKDEDKFVRFRSETLNRWISNDKEMQAAYDEMYCVPSAEKAQEVKPGPVVKRVGRPKNIVSDSDMIC